jgi:hypothetical protein
MAKKYRKIQDIIIMRYDAFNNNNNSLLVPSKLG